jgi:hypothetical protein
VKYRVLQDGKPIYVNTLAGLRISDVEREAIEAGDVAVLESGEIVERLDLRMESF